MRIPGLPGPSNITRSMNVDDERTINFYTEMSGPGTARVPSALYGTPGTTLWSYLGVDPVRGLFSQDVRAWAGAGTTFYELFQDQTFIARGALATSALPVQVVSNGSAGNQLFVVTAGLGYIYDLLTNVLTPITAPDFPPDAVNPQFVDGYFAIQQQATRRWQISALEDGTTWDGLDIAERSIASDNIAQLIRSHRGLWLLGTQTSEVWFNTGDPLFPFAPDQGALIEQGCVGALPACRIGNTIIWIGQNENGMVVVYRADGYNAVRISTHAVELALKRSADIVSTLSFAYMQEGHEFYWLYIPDLETSWVYDMTTGLWHERALWNNDCCTWEPHVARCACSAFEHILIGSRIDGSIYSLDLETYDDAP